MQRAQSQDQRIGSGVYAHTVFGATPCGHFFFKRMHFRSQDKMRTVNHPSQGGHERLTQGALLFGQI
jgi:hypothetical protein